MRCSIRQNYFRACRVFAVPLLTVAACSASLCPPPPSLQARLRAHPSAENYEQLGSWFGDRQQFSCASEAYRKALDLNPSSARLSYLLGLSLYSEGKLPDSVASLQQSIEIAPNAIKPHLLLATALDRLQRKNEAKAEWGRALEIDSHSALALDGLARELMAQGKSGEALSLLRSGPPDESLTIDQAEAYSQLRMLDEAAKLLTSASEKNPTSPRLRNALALVYMRESRNQEAEKLCASTVRQHPNDFESQKLYLKVLVLTGKRSVARALAQKLLAQAPADFDVLYINGVQEYDLGDFRGARDHLQRAIEASPDAPPAHFKLGQVMMRLNDWRGAQEQIERALDLGASEPEVHFELATVLRNLGENERAADQIELYQKGLKRNQAIALAASKSAQGDKELEGGDPHKAAAYYGEAIAATPDDAQLRFKLAVAFDRSGDIADERAALDKALQLNPDLAPAQNQLGFLASESGDPSEAEKHFREAVRAAPGFAEAWVNLAATLGLESRFTEAQQAVTNALQLDPTNSQALLLRDTLAKALAQH